MSESVQTEYFSEVDEDLSTAALDEVERKHLKDMLRAPGYKVLRKIQRAYLESMKDSANAISMQDPVHNHAEVIRQWTYVRALQSVILMVDAGVKWELEQLDKPAEERATSDTAFAREENLWETLGMLEKPPKP